MSNTRDLQKQRLNSLFQEERYDEAIVLAGDILADDPDNYIAHVVRCHSELLKPNCNLQAATSDMQWAITNHPDKPHGYLFQSIIYYQLNDFNNAITIAHLAINKGLNDKLELYCLLATSYYCVKDYKNACKYFHKVIKLEPDMFDFHYGLAKSFNLLCEGKNLNEITESKYLNLAFSSLEAIIKHERDNIKAYTIYAEILLKIQRYQDVIAKASEAIRLLEIHPFQDADEHTSQLIRNYLSRSEACVSLPTPDHTQAVHDLQHIIRLYKDNNILIPSNIYMARAHSEFFLENYNEALKHYKAAHAQQAEFDFNSCHRFAITYKALADNIVSNNNPLTNTEVKTACAYYNNAILILKVALKFNQNTLPILQALRDCHNALGDDLNIFKTELNITRITRSNQLQSENYQVCSLRELTCFSIFENYEKVKKHVANKGGLTSQENTVLRDNKITPKKIKPALELLGKRALRSTSFFPQNSGDEAKEPATKKPRIDRKC